MTSSVRTGAEPSAAAAPGLMPVLRPSGRLDLQSSDDVAALAPAQTAQLKRAFGAGAGHGLVALGADEVGTPLPPALAYWR